MEAVGEPASARDRILDTAYDLFSRHGIRAVGIDRIISESGVAKMSLYRNFHSKDELVLAFLAEREERWTRNWLRAEAQRRGETGAQRLLAIFDVFGEWFAQADFEGCSFINVLLEFTEVDHPVRAASAQYLANIRGYVREFAEDAGVEDPEALAGAVAHPDEGLDRGGRRRRRRCGAARPAPGPAAARERGRSRPTAALTRARRARRRRGGSGPCRSSPR